jgi:hypothetical protein
MDGLELLKSKWQEENQNLPKLSYDDIYRLLHKKSASIVKWIFIISIIELVFWIVCGFLTPESSTELLDEMGLKQTIRITYVFHYLIIGVFLVLFYLNHKNIKTTATVKTLMQKIIKTRKTVTNFVIYNLVSTALVFFYMNFYFFSNKEQLFEFLITSNDSYQNLTLESFTSVFFVTQFIVAILALAFIGLFYRIIYGILLKRLKNNYKELEKIEV